MKSNPNRNMYIANEILCLTAFLPEDNKALYDAWKDPLTETGFNFTLTQSLEEFSQRERKNRLFSTIVRRNDNTPIGIIMLSPEPSLPDLAIILYPPYRGLGYGKIAFSLAVEYCFATLKLNKIYAGCYPHNIASLHMLEACGFIPHPEGNQHEKHYITGENIIQQDFVNINPELV